MFSTPEKAFYLPSYVDGLAQMFIVAPSLIATCTFFYNKQVLDFLNIEAMQAKGKDHSCSPS